MELGKKHSQNPQGETEEYSILDPVLEKINCNVVEMREISNALTVRLYDPRVSGVYASFSGAIK